MCMHICTHIHIIHNNNNNNDNNNINTTTTNNNNDHNKHTHNSYYYHYSAVYQLVSYRMTLCYIVLPPAAPGGSRRTPP